MYSKIKRDIWRERWFLELSYTARYVYLYLITTNRINSAGIITSTLSAISEDLGICKRTIVKALEELKSLVLYDKKSNLIYIKGYITRQGNINNHKYRNSVLIELGKLSDKELENLLEFDCELRQFLEKAVDTPKNSKKDEVSGKIFSKSEGKEVLTLKNLENFSKKLGVNDSEDEVFGKIFPQNSELRGKFFQPETQENSVEKPEDEILDILKNCEISSPNTNTNNITLYTNTITSTNTNNEKKFLIELAKRKKKEIEELTDV